MTISMRCGNYDCSNQVSDDDWADSGAFRGILLCAECYRDAPVLFGLSSSWDPEIQGDMEEAS